MALITSDWVPFRYTTNSTEFPFSLWLYQKYFDIERIGWDSR